MNKIEYFYKVTRDGSPVPGSLQRMLVRPKGSEWRQLDYEPCCSEEIDVFLIGGQSNAVGIAKNAPSPVVTSESILQVNHGVISIGTDPFGRLGHQSDDYSAWPQFGLTYNSLTGRNIAFVPSARSGSAQEPAADVGWGNWSPTGLLFDISVTQITEALQSLTIAGYTPIFKGVLWLQGESDAESINNGTTTQASYQLAFETMISNYRAIYGSDMNFYIIRVGTRLGGNDSGYSLVRDSQEAVAAAQLHTHIIYRGTLEFPERGLMQDAFHYLMEGYNEIGRIGASEVINLT